MSAYSPTNIIWGGQGARQTVSSIRHQGDPVFGYKKKRLQSESFMWLLYSHAASEQGVIPSA
ncbi:hypothetical protein QMA77_07715 [Pantoea ananatis]|uniref:hypothetical protein n=1 Tax=Pantoea ananas TaxID=553 RepID=UPI000CF5257A|nr:hypothetical protein [Pantoea ananatis]MDI6536817.1 hypothetical protein [Pantoea ananatis]PQK81074.1 hypothetical protein CG430_03300 [Pantoea ananatis]QAB31578.1 hypothetical protein EPK90_18165 [Pantoea ananatis]